MKLAHLLPTPINKLRMLNIHVDIMLALALNKKNIHEMTGAQKRSVSVSPS